MALAKDANLKTLLKNQFRAVQPVQVRRRTEYTVVTNLTASAIGTGGTYTYGGAVEASDYNELMLEVLGTSLVLGSGAGLQARLEILSLKDQVWYPYPTNATFTNPTASLSPSAGTTVIGAYQVPSPFGGFLRVGFTCTTAFTSGQVSAALVAKG